MPSPLSEQIRPFPIGKVVELHVELGITRQTLYRFVGPRVSCAVTGNGCSIGARRNEPSVLALTLDDKTLRAAARDPQAFDRQTTDRLRSGPVT